MSYEPVGKEQPSAAREIPAPSPEIMAELKQISIESGQSRDDAPELSEGPISSAERVAKEKVHIVRSFDEAFAKGLDRKWEELGTRLELTLEIGERLTFDVEGRSIVAERSDDGVTFTVDGRGQEHELSRDFLMHNSNELTEEIRKEIQREEMERQAAYERERANSNHEYAGYDHSLEEMQKERRREDRYDYEEYRDYDRGEEMER
jgi:hypothetical protein